MLIRRGSWIEIEKGCYIQDSRLQLWYVEDMKDGWLLIRNREGVAHSVPPKPLSTPVTFIEPTEDEAIDTLRRVLGAVEWGKLEALAAYTVRAERYEAPELGTRNTAINRDTARSHILILHAEYVGDVKTMDGLNECHQSLHSDPTHQMAIPHHHPS